jgi:hypothetical protein
VCTYIPVPRSVCGEDRKTLREKRKYQAHWSSSYKRIRKEQRRRRRWSISYTFQTQHTAAQHTHTHTHKKTNDGKCLFLVGGIHVRSDVVEDKARIRRPKAGRSSISIVSLSLPLDYSLSLCVYIQKAWGGVDTHTKCIHRRALYSGLDILPFPIGPPLFISRFGVGDSWELRDASV